MPGATQQKKEEGGGAAERGATEATVQKSVVIVGGSACLNEGPHACRTANSNKDRCVFLHQEIAIVVLVLVCYDEKRAPFPKGKRLPVGAPTSRALAGRCLPSAPHRSRAKTATWPAW